MSDELLAALAATDEVAGARLVRRHAPWIHAFVSLNVQRVSDTDEITQETLLALFEAVKKGKIINNVRAYCRGTAYHKLCSYYRSRGRPCDLHGDLDEHSAFELDDGPHPFAALAHRRSQLILVQALRRIPLRDQLLLSCFYWDELKRREIAVILRVREGTVGSRLNKARIRLRRQIDLIERGCRPLHSTSRPIQKWRDSLVPIELMS